MSIPTLKELAIPLVKNIPRKKEVPEEIRAMIILHRISRTKIDGGSKMALQLDVGNYSFWGVQVYRRSDWTIDVIHSSYMATIVISSPLQYPNYYQRHSQVSYGMSNAYQLVHGWDMLYKLTFGGGLSIIRMARKNGRFMNSLSAEHGLHYIECGTHIGNLYINFEEKESQLFEPDMFPSEF